MERPTNDELFERYGMLAQSFAVAAAKVNPQFREDFSQDAYVALLKAADQFDWSASDDGYGFGALLKMKVQSEVSTTIAKVGFATSGGKNSLSSGELHAKASGALVDDDAAFVWDDSSDVESLELVREVAERVLTDRQYEAFARFYFDGICSDTHVAELMGVNRPAVQKLRVRAEERISEELRNMELL
jgi:DNA-directed RNA polymerase specialized sigma subunit